MPAILQSLLVIVTCIGALANAQTLPGLDSSEATPAVVEPISAADIARRSAAVEAELATLKNQLANAEPNSTKQLKAELEVVRNIQLLLRQQHQLVSPAAIEAQGADAATTDKASVFTLNSLYDEKQAIEKLLQQQKSEQLNKREMLATAKKELDLAERHRREIRKQFEQGTAGKGVLTLAQLDSRLKQEFVYLQSLEIQSSMPQLADQLDQLEQRIRALRQRLNNGEGETDAGFASLLERDNTLRRNREVLERRLTTAELRLEAAQARYARQAQPEAELLDIIESLTAHRDAITQEIKLVDGQAERLAALRTSWQHWDALLRGEYPREMLGDWKKAAVERIAALKQSELQLHARSADLQQRLEVINARLLTLADDSPLRQPQQAEQQAMQQLLATQRAELVTMAADRRINERLLAELQRITGHFNPLEYLGKLLQASLGLWSYEITAIDDAPVTVGSLIVGLLMFGIGLWASRLGSAVVGRAAEQRFKLDAGASQALQSLSFYILLVAFTLLALRVVHFPLTAFTVLGGALAIGIGFGSQNVMNNFISGLILMLERPVRARDVVLVDNNTGTIEKIGARSTQIRSTDGRHIIVPNSFFLESNVVNWTLSDDLIRANVTVGVAYGSPTRLVEELIERVVNEEELVLKDPRPIIIFEEFGDNALNFNVYFWVHARSPMGVRQVQSRVRFAIDDVFREHELVIAYPQRDVHLDSLAPIEIKMVNDQPAGKAD